MKKLFVLLALCIFTMAPSTVVLADYDSDSYAWNSYNDCINRGDYDGAISISPTNPKAFFYRGRSEVLHSQWDNAIADMTYSIKRDYNATDSYYYRGRAYVGKYETSFDAATAQSSLSDFAQVLQRDAAYGNAYFFRAGIYVLIQQPNAALGDYQKYLTLKNDNTNPDLINYANQQIALIQAQLAIVN